jgi:TRAP-type C4-dicarboxylate transport system substrate-binding protein
VKARLAVTLVLAVVLAHGGAARAEPRVLRIATVAPDGTSWAREMKAWARDVEEVTNAELRIKLYFGGIAGNEQEVLQRIRRDQLDGTIGSEICTQLAPSLKVARVVGVFQSRAENAYVLSRLKPIADAEFLHSGFINFGEAGIGPEVLFTREPVRDLAQLRQLRLWIWDTDVILPPQVRAMGLTVVQTPLELAGRAFDAGRFDGFITVPTAALAFQWTTQTRVLTTLRISFRSGCLIIAARAFDSLPYDYQRGLKSVAGKLQVRIEEAGRREDAALFGGLLSSQGLRAVPPSESLLAEFFDVARAVRPGASVVPEAELAKVLSWLADYRAEHAPHR